MLDTRTARTGGMIASNDINLQTASSPSITELEARRLARSDDQSILGLLALNKSKSITPGVLKKIMRGIDDPNIVNHIQKRLGARK